MLQGLAPIYSSKLIPKITYLSSENSGVLIQSSYTTGSLSIGTAYSKRKLLAIVSSDDGNAGSTRSCNSLTMTPNSGSAGTITKLFETGTFSGQSMPVSFWVINAPTGTTATFGIGFDGAMVGYKIELYDIQDVNTSAVYDSITLNNNSSTVSDTIDVPANGLLIACAYFNASNLSGSNMAWTGVTENSGESMPVNVARRSGSGAIVLPQGATGRTVSAVCTGSSSYTATLGAISLRPAI